MRFGLAAAVLAGCASGQQFSPGDGPGGGQPDSPRVSPDADVVRDAPMHDAHVPPDAFVYEDARVPDAFVYHDAPPCTPHTTNLLANPVFDLTPMGASWTEQNIDDTYPIITADNGIAAQSAPYKAWMGGWAGTDKGVSSLTDMLYQDVAVPAGTTKLELTGYYAVATSETAGSGVYDTANVDLIQTSGTPIEAVLATDNESTATAWTGFDHVFTANVSGQTVRLRFTTTNDITNPTSFYFDTLALNATHCP